MSIIFIDTETTGIPKMKNYKFPDYKDLEAFENARALQISWVVMKDGQIVSDNNFVIKPDGFTAVTNSHVHGITYEKAMTEGHDIKDVLKILREDMWEYSTFADGKKSLPVVVAHNIDFDMAILRSEIWRARDPETITINLDMYVATHIFYCTMKKATKPGEKWPTLINLHTRYFKEAPKVSHDALADCYACLRCFWFQQMNTDINQKIQREQAELKCY